MITLCCVGRLKKNVMHQKLQIASELIMSYLWSYFYKVLWTSSTVVLLIYPLSGNPTKWPNTLKQFVGKLPTNYLSVFDHFVKLALKGLKKRVSMAYLIFAATHIAFSKKKNSMPDLCIVLFFVICVYVLIDAWYYSCSIDPTWFHNSI